MIRNPHETLDEMLPNSKPWHRSLLVIVVTLSFLSLILTIIYTSYNMYASKRTNISGPFFTYTYDITNGYDFNKEKTTSTTSAYTRLPTKPGVSGKIISRTSAPPKQYSSDT